LYFAILTIHFDFLKIFSRTIQLLNYDWRLRSPVKSMPLRVVVIATGYSDCKRR